MGLGGFLKGLGKTALGAGAGFLAGGPAGALIGGGSALAGVLGKPKQNTTASTVDPQTQAYQEQMRMQAQNASQVALNGPGGPGFLGGSHGQQPGGQMGGPPGAPQGNSWFAGPQTMSIGDQASQFMNPYMSNVVDATRGEYDRLRAGALNQTNQQGTMAGAYGGSRQAVLAGARLGQLDQGQASTISNLMNSGYQNAMTQGVQYSEQQRQLREQQLQEPLFRQQQAQSFMQGGMGPVGQTTQQQQTGGGFNDFLQTAAGAASIYGGLKKPGANMFNGQVPMNANLGMNRGMPPMPGATSWLNGGRNLQPMRR